MVRYAVITEMVSASGDNQRDDLAHVCSLQLIPVALSNYYRSLATPQGADPPGFQCHVTKNPEFYAQKLRKTSKTLAPAMGRSCFVSRLPEASCVYFVLYGSRDLHAGSRGFESLIAHSVTVFVAVAVSVA